MKAKKTDNGLTVMLLKTVAIAITPAKLVSSTYKLANTPFVLPASLIVSTRRNITGHDASIMLNFTEE